jgi:hypothetical protein
VAAGRVLTKSAYAERHGITTQAVSNWIRRGKLTPPALRKDGKIDVARADLQLAGALDPVHTIARTGRTPTMTARPDPAAPPNPDQAASSQLLRARAVLTGIAAERARRELNAERGKYLLADAAQREWGEAVASFLEDVELAFADLAASADLSRAQLLAVRRWWREVRERSADRLGAEAAALPEFASEEEEAAE